MKRFFIRGTLVIFGVFLFFFSALATSEVLFLGDQQKSIALGKQFLFLQDDTKNLTINNILSHKLDALFQQGTRDVIAVGYVDADFWFKSPVLTNLSENPQWYITINGYATDTLKSASFYYVIEDKVKHIEYITDIATYQIENKFPIISASIPKELLESKKLQIIMRVEAYGLTNFPIMISTEKISYSYYKEIIFISFYIGSMTLLLVFNLFIFSALREKAYLFYICYIFFWIIVGAIGYYKLEVLLGLRLGYEITLIGYLLTIFLIFQFSYKFLEVKKNLAYAHYLNIFSLAFGAIVLISVFFDAIFAYKMLSALGMVMIIEVFIIAIICFLKKQRQAKLFIMAWTCYTLALLVWIVYNSGLFEYNVVLANIHLIGSLLETTFLSFALVDRYTLLQSEIQKTYIRLKKANVQVIQAFGTTVEKRDPYTAGHQFRVSRLAEAIAKQMNLEKHFIESVKLSALIHDIGKIGISKNLLIKKSKLSRNEFQKIKKHVQIGYEIIKNLDISQNIKDGILHHHERLDGSGYPKGIKKDKISLIGKILAVADTVEAVTNARPYRRSLGLKTAIEILKKGRNNIFDRQVVTACLIVLRAGFKF